MSNLELIIKSRRADPAYLNERGGLYIKYAYIIGTYLLFRNLLVNTSIRLYNIYIIYYVTVLYAIINY